MNGVVAHFAPRQHGDVCEVGQQPEHAQGQRHVAVEVCVAAKKKKTGGFGLSLRDL